MPLLVLPLDIPGEDMTAILEQTVTDLLQELDQLSDQIYSDGVFPGTRVMSAPVRLASYLEHTDPQDYSKIFDNDYLLRLGAGLDTPPVSPYWLNQLSVPGSFERNRRDFERLITQQQSRRDAVYGERAPLPETPNPPQFQLPSAPRPGAQQ